MDESEKQQYKWTESLPNTCSSDRLRSLFFPPRLLLVTMTSSKPKEFFYFCVNIKNIKSEWAPLGPAVETVALELELMSTGESQAAKYCLIHNYTAVTRMQRVFVCCFICPSEEHIGIIIHLYASNRQHFKPVCANCCPKLSFCFVDSAKDHFKHIVRMADTSSFSLKTTPLFQLHVSVGTQPQYRPAVWNQCWRSCATCAFLLWCGVHFMQLTYECKVAAEASSHVQKQHSWVFHHRFDLA